MTQKTSQRTRVTKGVPVRRPGLPARDTPMPPMGEAEALAFARRIVDLAADKKAAPKNAAAEKAAMKKKEAAEKAAAKKKKK